MTRDDLITALFGTDHKVTAKDGLLYGTATLAGHGKVQVLGVTDGIPLGVDEALLLAGKVIDIATRASGTPILFLVDSGSQRMRRRDELLGLNEYLAHLTKALLFAQQNGTTTVALLYGGSAAGAFIATALACGTLVALPDARPAVMDLPSMAKVTKLPIARLEAMAHSTPVFAPGLDNLVKSGAVAAVLDPKKSLPDQLATILAAPDKGDQRAALGKQRGGRKKAAVIAERVAAAAQAGG